MKRFSILLVGLMFLAMPKPARAQAALTTADEILHALRTVQVSVDFDATPLPDVLEFLADYTRINMMMSGPLHEQHQASPIEITLQVKDLPLQNLFKLMKSMYDLRVDYEEGVLLWKTSEETEAEYYTEVYDVKTLVVMLKDFPGVDMTLDEQGNMILIPGLTEEERNAVVDPDTLQDLIVQNCGGDDAWSAGEASMDYQSGVLIIRQTRDVHLRVANLLRTLR